MAWPENLESISGNLNTTELWILKERMESGKAKWSVTKSSGFAEYSEFVAVFEDTGERFKIEAFVETIDSVTKLE